MLSVFQKFANLYGPDTHPTFPWWRKHHQAQGSIDRWRRVDGTWEVSVDTFILGEITVRRLDLDEWEDRVEVEKLRGSWRPSSLFGQMVATGLSRTPAVIRSIPLSNDRFTRTPGVNPVTKDSYSQLAPRGSGPDEGMLIRDVYVLVDKMLAWLDRDHPMPRPSVWPGQCWLVESDGRRFEALIVREVTQEDLTSWIALLHGPTEWGRDVPWLDPSLLPPE